MSRRLPSLMLLLLLAFGAARGVYAQSVDDGDTAVLPVLNKLSGKIEGFLVLEPTAGDAGPAIGRRFGLGNAAGLGIGLTTDDSLALLCNRESGAAAQAIGALADNCMLASFGSGRQASATAAFRRGDDRVGVNAGNTRDTLPAWLTPGAVTPASGKVEVNDLTIFARKSLPGEGFVSFAGTVAKARLLSPAAAEASGLDTDQWTSRRLSVGAGVGNFGANIVGQVVATPGRPKWEGLGVGVTWRTPWSGQLSVGADNIITRGKSPFAPPGGGIDKDEGAVPYVRYEQDL